MRKGAESSAEGEMGRCPEIKGVGRIGCGGGSISLPTGGEVWGGAEPLSPYFFLFTGVNDAFGDSING